MSDDPRADAGAEQPGASQPDPVPPTPSSEPAPEEPMAPPMAEPAENPPAQPQATPGQPAYDPNAYNQPGYDPNAYQQPVYEQPQYAGEPYRYDQPGYVPSTGQYPPAQKPRISGGTIVLAIIAALVMGSIAGFAGGFLGSQASKGVSALTGGPQQVTVVPSTTDEPVVAAAAAAVPSVVNIDISGSPASGGQNGLPQSHPTVPNEGTGSGVAYKKVDGGGTYILTNNHVVEGAKTITVADASGKTYTGTLVGRDPDTDVAVVRIPGDLPIISVGDSSKLLVGQLVVAIGSPYGFQHSVTSGVVSALGRLLNNVVGENGTSSGSSLSDVIQTDAAINPGNSGGALVDRSGKLIGMNTAIYSSSGQSGGIGFAIPVNTAVRVANELIAGGKVSHPFIGLVGSTVTAQVAQQKKLAVQQGALVESLAKGAGAEKAGVKVGDVVTKVDSTDILSMDDLVLQVRRHAIGDTIQLTVNRGGKTLTMNVKVGDKPADFKLPSQDTSGTQ